VYSATIIGHGPSLKGAGLGKYIDSHDNIIRLTTYLNFQNSSDYGDITHYHYIPAQYVRYVKYNKDHFWRQDRGFCKPPIETWIGWNTQTENHSQLTNEKRNEIYQRLKDYQIIMFDRFFTKIRQMYEQLKPEYLAISSGVNAALLAIDRLRPDIIKMIGFDNTYLGNRDNYQGGESFVPTANPRSVNHDFKNEKTLLTDFAKQNGVTVIWEMLN